MESNTLRCADVLVKVLEKFGVKFIFGHPGEQVLPLYDALKESGIRHVLMRHEQGAAHAADGFARASSNTGVCIATGGPGALNLVMGVATAYKDSVPLLVITGDVPLKLKGKNGFQDIDINGVFQPITIESFEIQSPEEGILALVNTFNILEQKRKGPIHLNFPKDVLESLVEDSLIDSVFETQQHKKSIDSQIVAQAIELIENSKKPLIIAGSGVLWAHASNKLLKFAELHQIPVTSTYHARGVLPEDHDLSAGMIGLRGTKAANYAGKNADLILALGCRLSERTCAGIGDAKLIHVNLDERVLEGDLKIQGDVSQFLDGINYVHASNTNKWLLNIFENPKTYAVKTNFNTVPIKPQRAIKEIFDASKDALIVSDAGTHTTWVTLLKNVETPSSLLFSGGFGPMGYGVPGAIGASLANPGKPVVAVIGDGDFQMTLQELATIHEMQLPIVICIINNSSLRIIKQWQEMYYGNSYQVELENPDFKKLAESYHINSVGVNSPGEVMIAVGKALKTAKPYLIDIEVDQTEGIPLPEVLE